MGQRGGYATNQTIFIIECLVGNEMQKRQMLHNGEDKQTSQNTGMT